MTKRTLPSQKYLRQCFDYDPDSGILRWKIRPQRHFKTRRAANAWNAKYAGTEAGCKDHLGYLLVQVDGSLRRAHRVIWKIVTGVEPDSIDHVDGVPFHNSIRNLRDCCHQQNMQNVNPDRKNNTSGVKGVHNCKGKWRAMIRSDGKSRHIGIFDTIEQASAAYEAEAKRLFGEFVRQT